MSRFVNAEHVDDGFLPQPSGLDEGFILRSFTISMKTVTHVTGRKCYPCIGTFTAASPDGF
jgi:hypothetical protein